MEKFLKMLLFEDELKDNIYSFSSGSISCFFVFRHNIILIPSIFICMFKTMLNHCDRKHISLQKQEKEKGLN